MTCRPVLLAAFCLLATALAPAAEAQVVARQGTPEPVKEKKVEEFESPMILDLSLTEALSRPSEEFYFRGLGGYLCEGIGFGQLTFQSNQGNLLVKSVLKSEKRPKPFQLRFEILADSEILATKAVDAIQLEENRAKALETKIRLTPEQLDLFTKTAAPLLRITLTIDKKPGDFIKEADESGVASCEFVGTVSGSSVIGGLAKDTATATSVRNAKIKAEELGATHIVFLEIGTAGLTGRGATTARAYRCPGE